MQIVTLLKNIPESEITGNCRSVVRLCRFSITSLSTYCCLLLQERHLVAWTFDWINVASLSYVNKNSLWLKVKNHSFRTVATVF